MSDEVTHKNILAIRDYSKRSREIVRELEVKIKNTENENINLKNKIEMLEKQMQSLQVKVFSGGATSYQGHSI